MIQRSRAVGAEDKARAHDRDGVGKGRIVRQFLGLTPPEIDQIRARVARYLGEIAQRIG